MRPIKVVVGAQVASPWIPLEYAARTFNVGVAASLSEDASGITYSIEGTMDNPNASRATQNNVVSLTRTTTTATLTWAADHGLVTGDGVVVYGSGDANLDGSYAVASTPTSKSITYTVANTGATVGANSTHANGMRVIPLATALTAATTNQNASLTEPMVAIRLNVTAWTAGQVTLNIVQGLGRG